jgi:hypothetical protein
MCNRGRNAKWQSAPVGIRGQADCIESLQPILSLETQMNEVAEADRQQTRASREGAEALAAA